VSAEHEVGRLAEQIQEILGANASKGPALSAIRWPITSAVLIRKAIAVHARSGEVNGLQVQAELLLFIVSVPDWHETSISIQISLESHIHHEQVAAHLRQVPILHLTVATAYSSN
jgi:hypothetical protein